MKYYLPLRCAPGAAIRRNAPASPASRTRTGEGSTRSARRPAPRRPERAARVLRREEGGAIIASAAKQSTPGMERRGGVDGLASLAMTARARPVAWTGEIATPPRVIPDAAQRRGNPRRASCSTSQTWVPALRFAPAGMTGGVFRVNGEKARPALTPLPETAPPRRDRPTPAGSPRARPW